MRENEFIALAGQALAAIERLIDASGADVDCSAPDDGVLEIDLDGGGKIVVNRHAASQEIWLASRSGGFHFRWDGSAWKDTRSGRELMSLLRDLING